MSVSHKLQRKLDFSFAEKQSFLCRSQLTSDELLLVQTHAWPIYFCALLLTPLIEVGIYTMIIIIGIQCFFQDFDEGGGEVC